MKNHNPTAHTFERIEQAAYVLASPVRRFLIGHALKHGSVSQTDIRREFPALNINQRNRYEHIRVLVRYGFLKHGETFTIPGQKKPVQRYVLADISGLTELHQWLRELLEKEKTDA